MAEKLDSHLKEVHSRTYKCKKCDFGTVVRIHEEGVHEKIKMFKCNSYDYATYDLH